MKFTPGNLYHIYNKGSNRQAVFIKKHNYDFLICKIRKYFTEYSDVICYCLMPNHFHILVHVNNQQTANELNNEIGIMLRSYTRAINLQEERTDSLFQQKNKAKNVNSHSIICFNYIHQNPLIAGLTDRLKDWEYSSFNEYLGKTSNPVSNIELGRKIIGFKSVEDFYNLSYQNIDPKQRCELFGI